MGQGLLSRAGGGGAGAGSQDCLRMAYLNDIMVYGATCLVANTLDKFNYLVADDTYRRFLYENYQTVYNTIINQLDVLGAELNAIFGTDEYAGIVNFDGLSTETNLILSLYERDSVELANLMNRGLAEKIVANNADVVTFSASGKGASAYPTDTCGLLFKYRFPNTSTSYVANKYVDGVRTAINTSSPIYTVEKFTDNTTTYVVAASYSGSSAAHAWYLPIATEVETETE